MINIVHKDFNLPLIFSPCLCEYLCPPESGQFCIAGGTKCAKSAHWTIYWTLTLSSRLLIWRILHISCCLWCRIGEIPRQRGGVTTSCRTNPEALETTWNGAWIFLEAFGGFCKFPPVVQNWWHSPPERSVPTSCRSDAEALETTWTRTWIFLEAATGRPDRPLRPALTGLQGWPHHLTSLARHPIGWPPDHLTTWPPDHLTSLAPYWPNAWAACYLSGKGSGASQSGSIWSTERKRLVLKEVWLLQHLDLNLRLETWTLFKANPSLAKKF